MYQDNPNSSIENNFKSIYPTYSNTDQNIQKYLSRNLIISPPSPNYFTDDNRSTKSDDERNNNLNEKNSNENEVIGPNKIHSVEEKNIASKENKTKTNKKPKFKIIKGKTRRFKKKDNILAKIMRKFWNKHFIRKMTKTIKDAGSKHCFERFPQKFVLSTFYKKNKKIWKMNLIEIFKENGFTKYLNIIDKLKEDKNIKNDSWANIFISMNIGDIYDDYLDSDEFKRIIRKLEEKYEKDYIEKFQNYAKNFAKILRV
jgi:hypothetical protein